MYDFNGLYGGKITKDICIVKLYGFFFFIMIIIPYIKIFCAFAFHFDFSFFKASYLYSFIVFMDYWKVSVHGDSVGCFPLSLCTSLSVDIG